VVATAPKRAIVDYLKQCFGTSERRACRTMRIARAVYEYRGRRNPHAAIRSRMREIAQTRMRYGYRKIHVLLKREGYRLDKHLMRRLYREEGLALRDRPKRRSRAQGTRPERRPTARPNAAWSLDFVSDQLGNGVRFRALTVLDVFTRECVAITVGQRLTGSEVVETLDRSRLQRGALQRLFCDNGSEFTSQVLDLWAYHRALAIEFSRSGKPTDNAFIESFNGTVRDECLNGHWFTTLDDAKEKIEAWRQEYNVSRPHRALGEFPPTEFAQRFRDLATESKDKGAGD